MTRSQHGTRSRYVEQKCRCNACVKANRDYQLAYLHKRLAAGLVDGHGRLLDRSRLTKVGPRA